MARDPTIAYVLLRNSVFGPKGAASVELCVRDLARMSRYAASTLVVCPRIDEPFSGVAVESVPDVAFGGNLAKAWAVGKLVKRRGVDVAVVENHLPAAALIASASGVPTILHSHAYEKAPSGALKRAARDFELNRIAGLAFVSEDCANRFRLNFPDARAPMRAVPNGLDMTEWSDSVPKETTILSVGRALDDKGHVEAMGAITPPLAVTAGMERALHPVGGRQGAWDCAGASQRSGAFGGRIRIDTNLPYSEVKAAWEKAAVGMVLTKTPEPFGRTALEAVASGTALVASGLGGLAEVCGPDALIVDPADPDGVARGLASLLDLPELRAKLARSGRARVERLFDIRVVAKRMDDFVDEVLARPGMTRAPRARRAACPRKPRGSRRHGAPGSEGRPNRFHRRCSRVFDQCVVFQPVESGGERIRIAVPEPEPRFAVRDHFATGANVRHDDRRAHGLGFSDPGPRTKATGKRPPARRASSPALRRASSSRGCAPRGSVRPVPRGSGRRRHRSGPPGRGERPQRTAKGPFPWRCARQTENRRSRVPIWDPTGLASIGLAMRWTRAALWQSRTERSRPEDRK